MIRLIFATVTLTLALNCFQDEYRMVGGCLVGVFCAIVLRRDSAHG
jgi:hypothetical protein